MLDRYTMKIYSTRRNPTEIVLPRSAKDKIVLKL